MKPALPPADFWGSDLSFVAFDVETANSHRGSVCAMGLSVVRDGDVVAQHTWLVKPPSAFDWFEPVNISIHGITPSDVAGQPSFANRLAQALDVIGDLPVIAHNAAFDMGAVREGCDAEEIRWPTLTYGCTLVLSRRAIDLPSYRLPFVAAELGITLDRHHDAGADALAAARVLLALARRRDSGSLGALFEDLDVVAGRIDADQWSGCRRKPGTGGPRARPPNADSDADPDHPLFGQVVVFTGALEAVRRTQAWARVAELGATPEANVTRRTTMVVVGDGFVGDDLSDFSSGKATRAAAARARGQHIEVLSEPEFLDLLAVRTQGRRAILR